MNDHKLTRSTMKIAGTKGLHMDKSMMKGIALGGIAMVVLGTGAVTGYNTVMKPESAEVVAVKEVTETVVTPRERCEDVQVQHPAPVKDEHRVTGTVVGGLAGGLLGSTVGGGRARHWPPSPVPRPAAIQAIRSRRTCKTRMSSRRPSTAARP